MRIISKTGEGKKGIFDWVAMILLAVAIIFTSYVMIMNVKGKPVSVFGYSICDKVSIFGYQFLDFYDFISNNVIMPIVSLLTCILIGYFVKTKFVEEEVMHGEKKFGAKGLYKVMILVICPVCMIVILLSNLLLKL